MCKKFLAYVVVLSILITCTGCWDQKDVGDLAAFTVLAIDKVSENGKERWLLSVLVNNPSEVDGNNTGQAGKPVAPEAHWEGSGDTVQEALLDIIKRSPKYAYWGHLSTIIFGERAAREGVNTFMELELKFRETRPRTTIMVTKGEARKLAATEPKVARTMSEELRDLSKRIVEPLGISRETTISQFVTNMLEKSKDPVMTGVKITYPTERRGEKRAGPFSSVAVEGFGLFKDDRLVDFLNEDESLGYLLLTEKISKGAMRIKVPTRENRLLSYFLVKSKPRVSSRLVNGKLVVSVVISTKGTVFEDTGLMVDRNNIHVFEQDIADKLLKSVQHTIAKTRQHQVDPLGFTENLYRWHPAAWKQISDNWRDVYANAEVDITVNATITDVGVTEDLF